MSVDSLPPIDLPGVQLISLRKRDTISSDRKLIAPTRAGVIVLGVSSPELTLLSESGDRRVLIGTRAAELGPSAWSRLDIHGRHVAAVFSNQVAVLDLETNAWTSGPKFKPYDEASCAFTADGTLWVLFQRGEETTLSTFAPGAHAEAATTLPFNLAPGEGASCWLGTPHPREGLLPICLGMGQDGALTAFAHLSDGRLQLSGVVRDACFAGWSPSGDAHALLGHQDDVMQVRGHGGVVRRDLEPLLTSLDDCQNWQAVFVDERRCVVPTGEGRLLLLNAEDDVVTEVRLEGDSRNWDWSVVALVGDRLITSRAHDKALCVWDARPLR